MEINTTTLLNRVTLLLRKLRSILVRVRSIFFFLITITYDGKSKSIHEIIFPLYFFIYVVHMTQSVMVKKINPKIFMHLHVLSPTEHKKAVFGIPHLMYVNKYVCLTST
jgi:hypothetical protein